MNAEIDFDAMYERDDPWGFRTRWYEARRRSLLLACLPDRRYARALEVGCAGGEVSAALATRVDTLVATDASLRALNIARQHVAAPNVRFEQATLPHMWPEGPFDLVVFSEIGYYLKPNDVQMCGQRIAELLAPQATVVLGHWRHAFEAQRSSQAAVHALLREQVGLHCLAHYRDEDLELLVLCSDKRSVATREGLTP